MKLSGMNLIKFAIGLYSAILVSAQLKQSDEDTCRSPSGIAGTCIPITTCQFIKDTVKSAPRPLPPATVKLLQDLHCGFDSSEPKVCCPQGTQQPDIIDRGSEEPTDVSRHRNIGLINQKNCSPTRFSVVISRGFKTEPFQMPWMALISYNTRTGLGFRCGGTLINEYYILTAAHCITNLNGITLAGVRLGEHDISKEVDCHSSTHKCAPPVQDFTIAEVIPHPQYNPYSLENDIGLLRLSGPANVTTAVESVAPICLPTGDLKEETLIGQNALVAGWGVTEKGYTSVDLLEVYLPIISNEECQLRYNQKRTQIQISSRQMCAGEINGKAPCSGDSGGPLTFVGEINRAVRVVQYGIVSFGPKLCGMTNHPGVYTRVAYYMDWILDNMRP